MTNPVPTHAPKTDTPATQIPEDLRDYYADIKRRSNGYRSAEMEIVERIGRAESTLAAERASRDQIIQLHNDAAVEAIQRSQEYMAKYDKLVADGWDELKRVAEERDQAFNAGIEAAADYANGFGCLMEIVPGETKADHLQRFMKRLVAAIRTQSKPSVSPEQEKP